MKSSLEQAIRRQFQRGLNCIEEFEGEAQVDFVVLYKSRKIIDTCLDELELEVIRSLEHVRLIHVEEADTF